MQVIHLNWINKLKSKSFYILLSIHCRYENIVNASTGFIVGRKINNNEVNIIDSYT